MHSPVEPPRDLENLTRNGMRIAVLAVAVNAVLGGIKFVAGVWGHSHALVADAIESWTDIFGSVVVWSGLRIAARPADENHPYGHGKAEPLAALVVAGVLIAAGIGIAITSVREIARPHVAPEPYTLGVLIGVVIVKEVLHRVMIRTGASVESGAITMDAWHQRSDALTSAAAAIGIVVALVGGPGYEAADDWAALVAAGVIIYNGQRLIRIPLGELMDVVPTALIGEVRAVAVQVPGVAAVEKIQARKSGLSYWVDMHVEVERTMTVERAHGISHDVKDAVRARLPQVADVLIHIEPERNGAG
jgi:cation diffusion facilitator family transporter